MMMMMMEVDLIELYSSVVSSPRLPRARKQILKWDPLRTRTPTHLDPHVYSSLWLAPWWAGQVPYCSIRPSHTHPFLTILLPYFDGCDFTDACLIYSDERKVVREPTVLMNFEHEIIARILAWNPLVFNINNPI